MHLDMSTLKATNIPNLNSTLPTDISVPYKYPTSPHLTEDFFLSEMYTLDAVNTAVRNEAENKFAFSLENESFLSNYHSYKKECGDSLAVKVETISADDDFLKTNRLEDFQHVFYTPPPFPPFSSPASSPLVPPAVSPDEDIPNLNRLFSPHNCDLDSELNEFSSDLQSYQNPEDKVRDGNILLPIHNPPVMPCIQINDNQTTTENLGLAFPEGFTPNMLLTPNGDFLNSLAQIEDPNNDPTMVSDPYRLDKNGSLPGFSRILFPGHHRNGYANVDIQEPQQSILQKQDELLPMLNFKLEGYPNSENQIHDFTDRIFVESEVNKVNGYGDPLYPPESEHNSYRASPDSSINFNEFRTFDNLLASNELKGRAVRRGRRRLDCKNNYESENGSQNNFEEYENVGYVPDGRGAKRGAKAASLSR